jgi:hypothetical protein
MLSAVAARFSTSPGPNDEQAGKMKEAQNYKMGIWEKNTCNPQFVGYNARTCKKLDPARIKRNRANHGTGHCSPQPADPVAYADKGGRQQGRALCSLCNDAEEDSPQCFVGCANFPVLHLQFCPLPIRATFPIAQLRFFPVTGTNPTEQESERKRVSGSNKVAVRVGYRLAARPPNMNDSSWLWHMQGTFEVVGYRTAPCHFRYFCTCLLVCYRQESGIAGLMLLGSVCNEEDAA